MPKAVYTKRNNLNSKRVEALFQTPKTVSDPAAWERAAIKALEVSVNTEITDLITTKDSIIFVYPNAALVIDRTYPYRFTGSQ